MTRERDPSASLAETVESFEMEARPVVGVSECLLGARLRFDGGHKQSAFLMHELAKHVDYRPVCPEFEIGLGVPRESIRLQGPVASPRLVGNRSGRDLTEVMTDFAKRRVERFEAEALAGFVFKKGSPSCGMSRVRVYNSKGIPVRRGVGLFAAELMARMPRLPVEEEGRLNDPRLRENFLERVFAYQRLRKFFQKRWTVGQLCAFHAREKYLLMARSPKAYRSLGQLVAKAQGSPRKDLAKAYKDLFMDAMAELGNTGRHVNVLHHMLGYFSGELAQIERQEFLNLFDEFRRGLVPLLVPITMIRHAVRRFQVQYLAQQSYLQPCPKDLKTRISV